MDPSSFWGMDQSQGNKVFECTVKDTSKLHGVMTTNAMAYSWSPPSFKDGVLSYKVAGAHLDADGSVFKGTYDLAMNQESAKCIYGFSDAPIKASVSVVSSDGGVQEIATEMLTVKNGWLQLSAKNFTFSAPTIRIKLSQENSVKAAVTSTDAQNTSKNENKVAAPVTRVDDKIRKLIKDMAETMYAAPGIGLAATQVDVHLRVLVIDISETHDQLQVFINPEIIRAEGEEECEEGCLSVPGIYEKVTRAAKVTVKALDEQGRERILEADGLMAVCIQHEMDHLVGRVFVEKLSRLKQQRITAKLTKLTKQQRQAL
jgi:peptide deformylase